MPSQIWIYDKCTNATLYCRINGDSTPRLGLLLMQCPPKADRSSFQYGLHSQESLKLHCNFTIPKLSLYCISHPVLSFTELWTLPHLCSSTFNTDVSLIHISSSILELQYFNFFLYEIPESHQKHEHLPRTFLENISRKIEDEPSNLAVLSGFSGCYWAAARVLIYRCLSPACYLCVLWDDKWLDASEHMNHLVNDRTTQIAHAYMWRSKQHVVIFHHEPLPSLISVNCIWSYLKHCLCCCGSTQTLAFALLWALLRLPRPSSDVLGAV